MYVDMVCSSFISASDCFEIGKYAYEKKDSYHALMWLRESLSSHQLEDGKLDKDNSMDKILLLDFLTYAAGDVRVVYTCNVSSSKFFPFLNLILIDRIYYCLYLFVCLSPSLW